MIKFFIYALLFSLTLVSTSSGGANSSMIADYQESQDLMSAGEQEALFEVMEAMAGDVEWRVLHPHPCSEDFWPGIVCEPGEDGLVHVTRLDFGYKPNPACTTNASIPMAITKLSWLRSLFIFECFNTVNTTIPRFLVKLAPTLQKLSLRTNSALVGGIPIELANLSSLDLLSLSQNCLEGQIPPDLAKLKNLEHLDLSDNLLHGTLPSELGSLLNLVILDLSVNSLTGPIPAALGKLSQLQKMDVSFNSLEGPIPQELGNLRSLLFLAANDNFITGPYPPSLANWALLQYLILDNNPMNATLPGFIGAYTNLMALSLSNSGYYGLIPPSVGLLRNLTVLALDRNNLSGSIPMGLAQLPHIYQLNLSKNNLSGPIPFSPEFVRKLGRNLDLSDNSALCSHWSFNSTSFEGGQLGLCTNPEYSSFLSSSLRLNMISASSLCLLSMAIFSQF